MENGRSRGKRYRIATASHRWHWLQWGGWPVDGAGDAAVVGVVDDAARSTVCDGPPQRTCHEGAKRGELRALLKGSSIQHMHHSLAHL